MKIRPSRYSAVTHPPGHMTLWEDENHDLWLPWFGVRGTVWPANPTTQRVETDGLLIRPTGIPIRPSTAVLVEPQPVDARSIICRLGAEQDAPEWLKGAGVHLTTLLNVTIVEHLTLIGPA